MKMYAGTDLKDLRRYFRYSCEKIAFTTCQLSNVCCAMFNVVVKTPDDLLTKPPILNGKPFSHQVISSVSRFTSSSDIAQQTFDIDSLGCRRFFHGSIDRRYSCTT